MRFCGACGAPLAESAPATSEGEAAGTQRRHVTIMFCDLVGSTQLAERLDPEDFREVISGYQGVCSGAIQHFGGYVAQYQGDGVVAYFGYPSAHEDDARRAVHASLEIFGKLSALNERLREPAQRALQARVGLHTGTVITDDTEGWAHDRHSVVGQSVNIAARLQALARPGSIVVTDSTLALLGDRFETEPLGTEQLKGIARPVAVHSVVRRAAPAFDDDRPPAHPPIVDRRLELAQLADSWQRVRRGHGVLVHVTGEAGIGKSRLVHAFRELVGGEATAVRILHCSPHESITALYPVTRFLEQLTDVDRTPTPERQIEALERCVAGVGLDPGESVPLLADLLSIPYTTEAMSHLTPRDARNALLRTLEALLVGDVAAHPLLLVVEDLHWADPTTVELLERITARLVDMPVACVLAFRDEFQPPWAAWHDALEVDLGPLTPNDVRAIAHAISPEALAADTLDEVESAAEGVPLFVEEMVKAAVAGTGVARQRREMSRVPATLHDLLAERLDRLPALAGVIDAAAVLGREFEWGIAEELSPLDRPGFSAAVAQLMAQDVLKPVEGSRSRLEFRHALLHEVAYDRLVRMRRRTLHGRVAEVLAAGGPYGSRAEPERIAHHLARAGQHAEALSYWDRAGRRALERAAFLEAAEHFRRGLEALDETRPGPEGDLERADLLVRLGASLQAGRTPAADVEAIYAGARSGYQRLGKRERLMPVIRGEYLFHQCRAQYGPALALGEEMLAMGEDAGRGRWTAEGHFYVGFTRMMRGELDLARASLEDAAGGYERPERSEQIFEAQNDPGVSALAYLAPLLCIQGYTREALETSEQSLELAAKIGGPVTLALAWGMRCALLVVAGMRDELRGWVERARTQSVERNIGYWSNVCSMWSAWLQTVDGQSEEGTALLERHLDAYRASGGRIGIASFNCLLAAVYLGAGTRRPALELLRAGQEHIDATGERWFEPEVQWLTARALMTGEAPDRAAAGAAFERAVRAAGDQGARLWELRAAIGLAVLEREYDAAPMARARLHSLCRWFGADSQLPEVRKARALLSGEPAGASRRSASR